MKKHNILESIGIRKDRHIKCKGFYTPDIGWGSDFECGYNTEISCEECKYGKGTKNPDAKCNRIKT